MAHDVTVVLALLLIVVMVIGKALVEGSNKLVRAVGKALALQLETGLLTPFVLELLVVIGKALVEGNNKLLRAVGKALALQLETGLRAFFSSRPRRSRAATSWRG